MKDLTRAPGKTVARADRDKLFLLNLDTGNVVQWSAQQAVKPAMVDCDAAGNVLDPSQIPGDHPFILEQTKALADRMTAAGANKETLAHMGNYLASEMIKKKGLLTQTMSDCIQKIKGPSKAQCMAAAARLEIRLMALDACRRLGIPKAMFDAARLRTGNL